MIVAVANRKGGVGKTTVTLCLAAALANAGRRVLVVDLDENATELLRVGVGVSTPTVVEVLDGAVRVDQAVLATPWAGVDLVPSDFGLQHWSGTDDGALRERLHGWQAHDMVLVDCPPTLGPLTRNAMAAADRLLAVTEASFSALRGLDGFLDAFDAVRRAHNPDLRFAGVVLNLLDRNREQRGRLEELRDAIDADAVWEPFIPRRAVIAETLGAGRTLYDPLAARGAAAMGALFDDLAAKLTAPDPPPAPTGADAPDDEALFRPQRPATADEAPSREDPDGTRAEMAGHAAADAAQRAGDIDGQVAGTPPDGGGPDEGPSAAAEDHAAAGEHDGPAADESAVGGSPPPVDAAGGPPEGHEADPHEGVPLTDADGAPDATPGSDPRHAR